MLRTDKENVRKIRSIAVYLIIELAYVLFLLVYLNRIETLYSFSTAYESELYGIVVLIALFLWGVFGGVLGKILNFLFCGIYSLYLITQTIYNRAFHQYYRFNTVKDLLGEAIGAKDSAMEFVKTSDVMPLVLLLAVTVLFVVLYFVIQRKQIRLRYRLLFGLLFLTLYFPIKGHHENYQALIQAAKDQDDGFQLNQTDFYIYDLMLNTNEFVDKFGLLPLCYRDGETFLSAEMYGEETRQEVSSYLATLPEHTPNDHTGIFAGKNLIMIQAESYNHICLDEDLTPTLYKMCHEGINVEGFNTPSLPGSTSDTEFMSNVSLIPQSEGHGVCYAFPYNTYPTTLAKLFHDAGYVTQAFHNNYSDYYNRNVIFESFGYDEFLDSTQLGLLSESPDSDVMEHIKWIYAEADYPYFAFWITYSGHQPYSPDSVGVREEYLVRIKEKYPNLDERYAAYLAKNMDLDVALGRFLELLNFTGRLDKTVFVIFGDHLVKGLDLSEEGEVYAQMGREYSEMDSHTDLYIYNNGITPETVSQIGTAIDLLPTIANLWGLEYDAHTVVGRDLFDPSYHGMYFAQWGEWKTKDYTYDPIKDSYQGLTPELDLEQAKAEIASVYKKQEMSMKILKIDYFKDTNE